MQHDMGIDVVKGCDAIGTGLNVAEVTNVADFGVAATMDYSARVKVRACSLAALGEIAYNRSEYTSTRMRGRTYQTGGRGNRGGLA